MFQSSCDISFDAISAQDIAVLEERMYGDKLSSCGMLSPSESLTEAVHWDRATLTMLGISREQIIKVLESFLYKFHRKELILSGSKHVSEQIQTVVKAKHEADKAKWEHLIGTSIKLSYPDCRNTIEYDEFILIDDKFLMTSQSFGGAQQCPFQSLVKDGKYHGYQYGSSDYYIHNLETGQDVWFNTLVAHMILQHEFFEGDVFHRVAPEQLIEVLEIKADVDYLADLTDSTIWESGSSCSGYNIELDASRIYYDKESDEYKAAEALYDPNGPVIQYGKIGETLNLIVLQNIDVDIMVDDLPITNNNCSRGWYRYNKRTYKHIPLSEELNA